jgi:hypothetical protein
MRCATCDGRGWTPGGDLAAIACPEDARLHCDRCEGTGTVPRIKITAQPCKGADLNPGDLFSTAGPEYWAGADPTYIGEKVYVRTNADTPLDQTQEPVFRIRISRADDEEGIEPEPEDEHPF